MTVQLDNVQKAQFLRQIADYVELSTSPARVYLSLDVTLARQRVRFPSGKLDQIALKLASWAAEQIVEVARQFQRVNPGQGDDIIENFTLQKQELDKYVKV